MNDLANNYLRDRRISQRHNIKTDLSVRFWRSNTPEQHAESLNLSERGIFFATDTPFHKGEAVQVLVKMPREVSGEPPTEWRCTGLVVRVEPVDSSKGTLGVGVRFDCYEVLRSACSPTCESSVSHAG